MFTLDAPPHPALENYIIRYLYFSANSSDLGSLKQTFFPYDVPALLFCSGAFYNIDALDRKDKQMSFSGDLLTSHYMGLVTSPFSYYFKENEEISVFFVIFHPYGFSDPFDMNMSELTDARPEFPLLVGREGTLLTEQLSEKKDFYKKVKIVNEYFLKKCANSKTKEVQISEACRSIIVNDGLISMKELAYQTNMSQSKLERQFSQKVGVPPKLFARFKRFHKSLFLLNKPNFKSFTNVAYESGYYDQNHFIKEFKSFTGQIPSSIPSNEYFLFNRLVMLSEYYSRQ